MTRTTTRTARERERRWVLNSFIHARSSIIIKEYIVAYRISELVSLAARLGATLKRSLEPCTFSRVRFSLKGPAEFSFYTHVFFLT
jgi:hypothetical protein